MDIDLKKAEIWKYISTVEGGEETLAWLKKGGFFTAPASMKHHGAYSGGLFDHSRRVAFNLINMTDKLGLRWERKESPAIVGVLHDVCKMDQYILKSDGSYEWNEEQIINGHGEKSCILLLQHMKLTDEELMCIRYHMGAFEGEAHWNNYTGAIRNFPNVLYTHMADMVASQIENT